MKKNILSIALACLICCSCGDFLEEYSQDLVYANSCEDLNEILIGDGYMKRGADQEAFYYDATGQYYPHLHVMDDDAEEFISGKLKMAGFGSLAERLRNFYTWGEHPFSAADGTESLDSDWKRLYKHIGYVNVIISYVDEFKDEPEEIRNKILGEAYFLRGWYYYMLVNLYAEPYNKETASQTMGIPLNVTEYIEDKLFERTSVEKVYKQIVSDLSSATKCLSGILQPTYYRANEAAAHTLLSRVYLYMERWEDAIAECDKALALGCRLRDMNELTSSAPWHNTVDSPEILFTQGSYFMGCMMNNRPAQYGFQGGGRYRVSDDLLGVLTKYKEEDIEDLRATFFLEPSSRYCPGFFFIRKTPDGNNNKGNARIYDACLIRSAEIYLNKAEAEAMLDKADSKTTLKTFMEYRYKDGKYPAVDNLNGQEWIRFIRDERRKELCFEGHRWFDLRRYAVCSKYPEKKAIVHNVYASAMANMKPGVYDGSYTLKPYGEDNAWVLPLPDYEVIFNEGKLENNPSRINREKNQN